LRSLCLPVSAVIFCAICVPQPVPLSFAQFVSTSQCRYLLRNLCRPFSAVIFCAVCVPQSAPLSFAQFVSPNQCRSLLCYLFHDFIALQSAVQLILVPKNLPLCIVLIWGQFAMNRAHLFWKTNYLIFDSLMTCYNNQSCFGERIWINPSRKI
jgi:hypothetical protein